MRYRENFTLLNYAQPVEVVIDEDFLTVHLSDGRIISNLLEWFTWLANATSEQRQNYTLSAYSIDWDDLDNGVDVEGMLRGIKPRTPENLTLHNTP